jgi:malic enzyme
MSRRPPDDKGTDADTVEVRQRGFDLIRTPLLNKGTAFSAAERRTFKLEGLLPHQNKSLAQQARRVYAQISRHSDNLEKYVAIAALRDRNETLFYRVLIEHLDEFMPIIYTPTVGLATQRFSHVFQQGRGIWITPDMKGRMEEVLRNAQPMGSTRLLVVTDNESILGIGDQGAGGMAISLGKLALYSAGAGIYPGDTLPVSLDFGTDNEQLLADEQYLGWPERRLRGTAYFELVEEFVEAVCAVLPGALVQWEDFRKDNALKILDTYRDRLPSFNDDIQGTGAVVAAGLMCALSEIGQPLAAQRIVIYGAGAGGLGVARQIEAAMVRSGMSSAADRRAAIAVLDRGGLLADDRKIADEYKRELAWPAELAAAKGLPDPARRDLAEVVAAYRPTVLLGVSGQGGAFTEAIVRDMAQYAERPIIFPCSNPTEYSEATPADLYNWTNGCALVATGSPFPDVECDGRTIEIGQGNNVFIFPGLGLGALAVGARKITDGMIHAASDALAVQVTAEERARGLLFPSVERLRTVSLVVAMAVGQRAIEAGVAEATDESVEERIAAQVWNADYPEYIAV